MLSKHSIRTECPCCKTDSGYLSAELPGTSMVQLSMDPVSDNVDGVGATGPLAAAGFSAGVKLQESAADHQSLLTGLARSPKHLPCSYLYDSHGSKLYDDITELEKYYLFRTEQALLHTHAGDIVSHIQPGDCIRLEVNIGIGHRWNLRTRLTGAARCARLQLSSSPSTFIIV